MNVQNRGRIIENAQDGPGRNTIREIPVDWRAGQVKLLRPTSRPGRSVKGTRG